MSNLAQPAARKHSRLLLPIVLIAVFVMPISISGTAIAIPAIAHDLGSDPQPLQWIINGFNASFAIFTLFWGPLADRIGYRLTFILGTVIILVASLVSALSPNLLMLDFGRILAGAGGAAVFTAAAAILSNAFTDTERGRAFAFFGTTIGLGVALGPTISGGLVAWLGWRGVFFAFALVMVIALLGTGVLPKIDVHHEPGQKSIDFSLLRNKRFLAFALVPVAAAVGYVTLLSYLPVAFAAVYGMSAGTAGLFMLFATVPVLIGPVLASQLISRFARVTPMTMIFIALIFYIVGDLGILLINPSTNPWLLALPMILLGFGFGFPIGLVDGEALAAVPARSSGTAAGVLNFLRLGSEAVVVGAYAAIIVGILGTTLPRGTAERTAAGVAGNGAEYVSAMYCVLIGLAVLTAALTLIITILHHRALREGKVSAEQEAAATQAALENAVEARIDPLA